MLQEAYNKYYLSKIQVFKWHKTFKDRREDVGVKQHAGFLSTSRISDNEAKIKTLLASDTQISIQMIAKTLGLTNSIVQQVVKKEL